MGFKFSNHKDFPTQSPYIASAQVQFDPVIQSLQAPLHHMTPANQNLSMASLSASLSATEARLMAQSSDIQAAQILQSSKNELSLSKVVTNALLAIIQPQVGNEQVISTVRHQIAAAFGALKQLINQIDEGVELSERASRLLESRMDANRRLMPPWTQPAQTLPAISESQTVQPTVSLHVPTEQTQKLTFLICLICLTSQLIWLRMSGAIVWWRPRLAAQGRQPSAEDANGW